MSTLKYYVWLASRKAATAAALRVLRHFGTAEKVFFANEDELLAVPELNRGDALAFAQKDLAKPTDILAKCAELGHRIVTIQDAEYPERLRNIYDPPIVLYVKGRLPAIDEEPVISVVGTRNFTPYGLKQAELCGYELARHGIVVATGLARGGDTAAMLGALRGGGTVIGLLGCGLDVVYPAENAQLYEDVASVGALISEYPPGTEPAGVHFPVRNRILSGIALGVAVIEAPHRSGTLITASRALEQGRDVFAMPGNVDAPTSVGANRLLREGAIPMTSAADIVSEYAALFPLKIKTGSVGKVSLDEKAEKRLVATAEDTKKTTRRHDTTEKTVDNAAVKSYIDSEAIAQKLTGIEKTVFEALCGLLKESETPQALLDDIIDASQLAASDALSAMTMLEIDGFVQSLGGGYYGIT